MFELFVLGLILVGLVAISRAPMPRHQTENPTQPVPTLWSDRTDWHRFYQPTYLRRGIVIEGSAVSSLPPRRRRFSASEEA